MRQVLAKLVECVAVLAAPAGSASAAPASRATTPVWHEVAVSDLMGRSPLEVVSALGGKPPQPEALFVSAASVDGGKYVTILSEADVNAMGALCPRLLLYGVSNGRMQPSPRLRFQEGRLLAVDVSPLPKTYDQSPPEAAKAEGLRWICRAYSKPGMTANDAVMGLIGAPFIAASAAKSAWRKEQFQLGDAALSELTLGAPVPGGVAAFVAAHASSVKIVAGSDGTVDLQIDMGLRRWVRVADADSAYALHVAVRDGRAVRLAKGYLATSLPCQLAAFRLRCGPTTRVVRF
jgi:hypothetical protein